jgi:hypothetical protein
MLCFRFHRQIVGAFASWKWQCVASAALTIIGHGLLTLVPETPRFLVSKGRFDEAKESLCWLKNTKNVESVEGELLEVDDS